MLQNSDRDIVVAALRHAAPYVRLYRRKIFVIKAGGEVFADSPGTRALIEQIAILHQVGIRMVLVHGGGPQNTRLAEALGVETLMVEGRRVTDERTLEVATMVLNGQINTQSCRPAASSTCRHRSERRGRGLCCAQAGAGARAGPPAPVDYGFVGDIGRGRRCSRPSSRTAAASRSRCRPTRRPSQHQRRHRGRAPPRPRRQLVRSGHGTEGRNDPASLISYVDLAGT
jgi:hypothetical protein